MRLYKAKSTGTQVVQTLHGPIKRARYPKNPTGELIVRLGRSLGLSLRDVAKALKIRDTQVYALKHGRLVVAYDTGFHRAAELLVKKHEELNPPSRVLFDLAAMHGFGVKK